MHTSGLNLGGVAVKPHSVVSKSHNLKNDHNIRSDQNIKLGQKIRSRLITDIRVKLNKFKIDYTDTELYLILQEKAMCLEAAGQSGGLSSDEKELLAHVYVHFAFADCLSIHKHENVIICYEKAWKYDQMVVMNYTNDIAVKFKNIYGINPVLQKMYNAIEIRFRNEQNILSVNNQISRQLIITLCEYLTQLQNILSYNKSIDYHEELRVLKYNQLCCNGRDIINLRDNESCISTYRYSRALQCYLEAEALIPDKTILWKRPDLILSNCRLEACIGDVYYKIRNYQEAIKYLKLSLSLAHMQSANLIDKDNENMSDTPGINQDSAVNEEDVTVVLIDSAYILGSINIEQNNKNEAIKYFQQAMHVANKFGSVSASCSIALSLGKIYFDQNNFSAAKEYFGFINVMVAQLQDKIMLGISLYFLGRICCNERQFIDAAACLNGAKHIFCYELKSALASRKIAHSFARLCNGIHDFKNKQQCLRIVNEPDDETVIKLFMKMGYYEIPIIEFESGGADDIEKITNLTQTTSDVNPALNVATSRVQSGSKNSKRKAGRLRTVCSQQSVVSTESNKNTLTRFEPDSQPEPATEKPELKLAVIEVNSVTDPCILMESELNNKNASVVPVNQQENSPGNFEEQAIQSECLVLDENAQHMDINCQINYPSDQLVKPKSKSLSGHRLQRQIAGKKRLVNDKKISSTTSAGKTNNIWLDVKEEDIEEVPEAIKKLGEFGRSIQLRNSSFILIMNEAIETFIGYSKGFTDYPAEEQVPPLRMTSGQRGQGITPLKNKNISVSGTKYRLYEMRNPATADRMILVFLSKYFFPYGYTRNKDYNNIKPFKGFSTMFSEFIQVVNSINNSA